MRSATATFAGLSVLASAASALVVPSGEQLQDRSFVAAYQHEMRKRDFIGPDGLNQTYDYIICGGGVAGLTIAARLAEDANKTILVLEAGDTGDAVKESIDVPANAYYSSLTKTDYDWQYKTTPQPNLNNREIEWPRGKVVGGSSAINGLYLVRPSSLEVNTWAQLAGTNGSAWNWDNMFAAMKKSETFTPPSDEIAELGKIQYNIENHGTDGPLHYSYPGYLLPIVGDWTTALNNIGVEVSPDPNGGNGWGAFIATSSINPSNLTRSYAKSAYIDSLPPRHNMHILPNARVLKINTEAGSDGMMKATGVQWGNNGNDRNGATITAKEEVILTGGAVGSPHMLMVSGIGPKENLESVGVQVVHALPGVGQQVTDHVASEVIFKTSANTAATERQTLNSNGTQAFMSFVNSAIAYSNITDLFGDYAPTFKDTVAKNLTWAVENVCPSKDETVKAGYTAVHTAVTENFLLSKIGQVELLLGLTGTAQGGDDSIAIQAALQHPFSAGQIYLSSSNPWEYPIIDPNYLAHPADTLLLREGLKLARKLGGTAPLKQYMLEEVFPGPSVQSDAEWDTWLATQVKTEYHPSSSCSMMPLDKGGVVDGDLKVHGFTNLRVADSSVFPIQFAAHLQSLVYGLGEIAAQLIKDAHFAQPRTITPNATTTVPASESTALPKPTSSGSGESTAVTTETPNEPQNKDDGAGMTIAHSLTAVGLSSLVAVLALL